MVQMVRKQIYIQRQHEVILKRLSEARGVSEAELIRQAIDNQVSGKTSSVAPDPVAWKEAHEFMLALQARGPLTGQSRRVQREELYEEQEGRDGSRSD